MPVQQRLSGTVERNMGGKVIHALEKTRLGEGFRENRTAALHGEHPARTVGIGNMPLEAHEQSVVGDLAQERQGGPGTTGELHHAHQAIEHRMSATARVFGDKVGAYLAFEESVAARFGQTAVLYPARYVFLQAERLVKAPNGILDRLVFVENEHR